MSFKVTRLVRSARLPRSIRQRPEAKAVLLALADRCQNDGTDAWPSVATIAEEVEVSPRTAFKCLNALASAGLIHEQAPPTQHRPRTWRLDLTSLAALSDPQPVAALTAPDRQPVATLARQSERQNRISGLQNQTPDRQKRHPDRQPVADDPVLLNRERTTGTTTPDSESSQPLADERTKEPIASKGESNSTKFLNTFKSLYHQYRGSVYHELRSDSAKVNRLLGVYGFDHLVEMATALMSVTAAEDKWIADGNRAIGVLNHRAAFLHEWVRSLGTGSPAPAAIDTPEIPPLWDCVRDDLRRRLPRYEFETWLGATRQVCLDGDLLTVSVSMPEQGSWIERHYGDQIRPVLTRAGVNRLEFVAAIECR